MEKLVVLLKHVVEVGQLAVRRWSNASVDKELSFGGPYLFYIIEDFPKEKCRREVKVPLENLISI